MRRWNGWGDKERDYPLKPEALEFLHRVLGPGKPLHNADLKQVIAEVPPSRVDDHPLLKTDAETRIRHGRGQSAGDWLAMKSGDFGVFPDAVAEPKNQGEVRTLMDLIAKQDYLVIPYGGGTSVAGHITPAPSARPIVTLSLRSLNQLESIDTESQIATFGAGANGPEVESQLRGYGYTLGHFPQSFELSTIGGWVATRSSGQQSLRYGRIEQLFAGGTVETPRGTLDIPTFPASSAGPDIREMVLGSEGRLGVITRVKVRVARIPEKETFIGVFFPEWHKALTCVREVLQHHIPLSMMRLSNPIETRTNLTLAGHKTSIGALESYLRLRGIADGKCMLMMGLTGDAQQVQSSRNQAFKILSRYGGVSTSTILGTKWAEGRFKAPYLREALWEKGYMVDTVETAADWNRIDRLIYRLENDLREGLADEGEEVHGFTHLSHMYTQGSSCYTTYVFRVGQDYEETYKRWHKLKSIASEVITLEGGTISHQHGVGKDHRDYLLREKDDLGMDIISSLMSTMDPKTMMNPGTLI